MNIMAHITQTHDRRTLNKATLLQMALMLLDNADDIESLFPFQANSLRNMAKEFGA